MLSMCSAYLRLSVFAWPGFSVFILCLFCVYSVFAWPGFCVYSVSAWPGFCVVICCGILCVASLYLIVLLIQLYFDHFHESVLYAA